MGSTKSTSGVVRTLRLKVRGEAYPWLNAAAFEVNQVWNYCNETSFKAVRPYAQGQLATRLAGLDALLDALRTGTGAVWASTAVLVCTEFGRTVEMNGTHGTDHGTATAALLLGGAVRGGRVLADWPGLAAARRRVGRDLEPTGDLRALCRGVLRDHLELPERALAEVFPGS